MVWTTVERAFGNSDARLLFPLTIYFQLGLPISIVVSVLFGLPGVYWLAKHAWLRPTQVIALGIICGYLAAALCVAVLLGVNNHSIWSFGASQWAEIRAYLGWGGIAGAVAGFVQLALIYLTRRHRERQ